ncbi:MAG TPA: MFS transporter [Dehalococcoidia bacterium]|nr:MFS transporter [Dehalococcoidia bacterium]
MVAAGFGIQLLCAGLLTQSFGAYVAVINEKVGWSKAELAAAFSLLQLVGGLISPVQGSLMDRVGPRAIMRIGVVIFAAGFVFLSQVHSLWLFYVAFIVIGIGFRLTGFFALSVAVVNWFERRRARALSTVGLGVAVGGLLVPVVAYSLEHAGWRPTALASGVILLLVGLPLIQAIRHRPEDHGEVVDGRDYHPREEATVEIAPPEASNFTASQALHTRAFWLISAGHGSALLVVAAVNVHVISHLKDDLGYSVSHAALIVTLMTSMQVVGILIGGTIGDRFDKRLISAICMLMHMVGLLLVTYAVNLPMIIAFAVLHGLAWGTRGPLMQAIRADYFGRKSFGAIMGLSALIVMIGQISGPLVAGILADTTGNYDLGFTVIAVLAGLASVFFLLAKRPVLSSEAA